VVRWRRPLSFSEAILARTLHLTTGNEWNSGIDACAVIDAFGRHRLASAAEDVVTTVGGIDGLVLHYDCGADAHASVVDLSQLNREAPEAPVEAQREKLLTRNSEIEHPKLIIAKLRRMIFGTRSEKIAREVEQLELKLKELETGEAARPQVEVTSRLRRAVLGGLGILE
jgi:Transposase C of IS166 homeodomain